MIQPFYLSLRSFDRLAALSIGVVLLTNACSNAPQTSPANQPDVKEVPVTVTDTGCEPGQFTVAAGRTTFVITNKSSRALEWEILDGVKVVEEKENIVPGLTQKVKAMLASKDYVMTCGLRSNPKGKITVSATN